VAWALGRRAGDRVTRVVVNAAALPSFRQGGAGFYAATLVDGLSRRDGLDVAAVVPFELTGELAVLAPVARALPATPTALPLLRKAVNYAVAAHRPEALALGHTVAGPLDADVVHWPISFLHAPAAPPGAVRVLTVLDLQHVFFPAFFSRRDRVLRRLRWAPSARAADRLIAISAFTADTIAERFGIERASIDVVPLSVRSAFTAPPAARSRPDVLRGDGPWFLYPASPLPAKNHARLLEAFRRHREQAVGDPRLVLVGPRMHAWAPVEREVARLGLAGAVDLVGHVDDALLRAL